MSSFYSTGFLGSNACFFFSPLISVCLILVLYYVGFITSNTMSLLTERNMVRGGGVCCVLVGAVLFTAPSNKFMFTNLFAQFFKNNRQKIIHWKRWENSRQSTEFPNQNLRDLGTEIHGHRLINNTDRTLDVVFSRLRDYSFTITLRQRPKGVTCMLSLCLIIQRCLRGTLLGFASGSLWTKNL